MFLREVGDQYFCVCPEIVKGAIFNPLEYLCSIVFNYIIHQLQLCPLKPDEILREFHQNHESASHILFCED